MKTLVTNVRTAAEWTFSFLAALQFFTRIPIDGLPSETYTDAGKRRSATLLPLVGVVTGTCTCALFFISTALRLPTLVCAAISIGGAALLTGAFHEDGLADFFDSCGVYDRTRALEVMRDSRIGTFGATALIISLLLRCFALAAIPIHHVAASIICAHILGRTSSLCLAKRLPYARLTPGTNKTMIEVIGKRELVAGSITAAVLCAVSAPGVRQLIIFIALTAAVTLATEQIYNKRFAGITGDCLGATNQMVEMALLTAASSAYMA